jgi:ribosome-associated protein
MNESDVLIVNDNLQIPLHELHYRYARSHGPGGQHVNRTESQVELLWDVRRSPSLSKTQRQRIERTLARRIDKEGVLHLTSSVHRSQLANKRDVTDRFVALLREAVKLRKKRVPSRPSLAAKQKRLQAKRRRAQIKQWRGKVRGED